MRAIIPAAGIGERLRPLTLHKPKVLIPVAGKPIIGHIYERLMQLGIEEVTVIIGHFGEQVKAYSQQNFPLRFTFIEQPERRGLGHAVGLGLDRSPDPVLIILGDTILNLDYSYFVRQSINMIGVMMVSDPRRFGVVVVSQGRVTQLVEKPEQPISNLAIAGIYLIQDGGALKAAVDYIIAHDIRTKNEYQLTDALQVMLKEGAPFAVAPIDSCYDCGTKETLLAANRSLLANLPISDGRWPQTRIIPPVAIAPDAQISNSIIGPYVTIAQGVKVENSVIEDAIIDAGAVIRGSRLVGTLVAEGTVIEDNAGDRVP